MRRSPENLFKLILSSLLLFCTFGAGGRDIKMSKRGGGGPKMDFFSGSMNREKAIFFSPPLIPATHFDRFFSASIRREKERGEILGWPSRKRTLSSFIERDSSSLLSFHPRTLRENGRALIKLLIYEVDRGKEEEDSPPLVFPGNGEPMG